MAQAIWAQAPTAYSTGDYLVIRGSFWTTMDSLRRVQTIIGHVVTPQATAATGKPRLLYFPIGGRGELIRLIAAAGGLEISDEAVGPDAGKEFFGALPILVHGDMRICQSQAMESYVAALAPKYKSLTPQQRAVDDMYAGIKED